MSDRDLFTHLDELIALFHQELEIVQPLSHTAFKDYQPTVPILRAIRTQAFSDTHKYKAILFQYLMDYMKEKRQYVHKLQVARVQ
ncbi:hypothetical protein BGX31_001777, partial [Mortierella sp. GBA43]